MNYLFNIKRIAYECFFCFKVDICPKIPKLVLSHFLHNSNERDVTQEPQQTEIVKKTTNYNRIVL